MTRRNGRKMDQIRECRMTPGFVDWCSGSVLMEMGRTMVLCNASVMESVPPHRTGTGKGWITAEYAMLPCAGFQRSPRESREKTNARSIEIQRLIGRSLRPGINMQRIPDCTIILDCDVIKADGGTRTASITGAWVALRIALWKYFSGILPDGILKTEWIAAISAGLVGGVPMLDLEYEEDSRAEVDLNLVLNSEGHWIDIQATAEGESQDPDKLTGLFQLAQQGISHLWEIQSKAFQKAVCRPEKA